MAEPHLQWLLDERLLVCPTCGTTGAFVAVEGELRCDACDRGVPVIGGVPDFFDGYLGSSPALESTTDHAVITEIASILQLPENEEVRGDIARALHTAARDTDHPALTAEIREVHARFVGGETELPPVPDEANVEPMARIERDYAPSALVVGETRFVNVRFQNIGRSAWSSRTQPVAITAAARLHRRSFGRWIAGEATYTALPIDIEPGRAITLPIEIAAPTKPGAHRLEIGLFQHPNGFIDSATIQRPVRVENTPRPVDLATTAIVERRPGISDYGDDHQVANSMVEAALERTWPGQERRIVEIGGSTHPQSWNHQRGKLVNLDISSPTLQLGVLYDRHHGRSIAHLCADATSPPLAPGSFHAVTMYATLHHFAQPEALLRTLSDLLVPGGFVAVMCEPSGTTLASPGAIRDLLGGINEQTFAVDEYLWMAERAGLRVDQAVDHAGSFKAILVRG